MILKARPEDIRTAGKKLVANAESYLASVKSLYQTVDGLKATWQGADNQQFAATCIVLPSSKTDTTLM